ncbi:hypothetical protein [Aeromonas sp. MR16]|uniref:hypothetical protein n=1 Tax=Aeromonas sp. MR16 TaxID=2923420 RepID=UPI001F4AA8AE|nr:hypothetical protein [Aeromonas sp. MR16]MCH7370036.1 hypothetical protein [Aeromonas sp. MR16]
MRVLDLDQISDEAIDLSQFLAVDDPAQTFKMTLLQLADFLEARTLARLFPVGSTLYRVDNRTPMELGFPGTWTKASPDVTLATGLADGTDSGSYTGTSDPVVPIPDHGHSASQDAHFHTGSVGSGGAHTHNVSAKIKSDFLWDGVGWDAGRYEGGAAEHHQDTNMGPIALSAGEHAHGLTIDQSQPAVHVSNAGTAGATLDVRGLHLNGQLWLRTA